MDAEAVEQLASITGLDDAQATVLLEAAGGDLSVAVQLHFEQEDNSTRQAQIAADAAMAAEADAAMAHGGGRADASDDDDDDGGGGAAAALRARQPPAPVGTFRGRLHWALAMLSSIPGASLIRVLAVGLMRLLARTGIPSFLGSLLGLVAPGPRPPTGALAVRRFESGFEEAHGPVHPVFYRGSLQQALGHSRREAKFLLVYLHAADHPNCETFAAAVLASQPFSAFVDENFVLWVADVAASDGLQARRATRVQELPAMIMLAHGDIAAPHAGGGPAQQLMTIQGERLLDAERLVAHLRQTLTGFNHMLAAARAEAHERQMDQMLRAQQQEEYASALAEDQAREAAEAAAQEAEEREERERADARRRRRGGWRRRRRRRRRGATRARKGGGAAAGAGRRRRRVARRREARRRPAARPPLREGVPARARRRVGGGRGAEHRRIRPRLELPAADVWRRAPRREPRGARPPPAGDALRPRDRRRRRRVKGTATRPCDATLEVE